MESKRRTNINHTIEYYESNAADFIKSTIDMDVSELYWQFEELITPGGRILDLGCGSGRDSKYFSGKGYDVVALDPSPRMCAQTKALVNIPVYELKAEEMQFSNEFDGVWACASLLHVPRDMQENVLHRIADALKDEGILYASWKYGTQDREVEGRRFFDMNESLLCEMMSRLSEFHMIKKWTTKDIRSDLQTQIWLNVLLKKRDRVI